MVLRHEDIGNQCSLGLNHYSSDEALNQNISIFWFIRMPDLSSSKFKMDTLIKDFRYWIKDALWMEGRSISRVKVGEFEGSSSLVLEEKGGLNDLST